MASPTPAEIEEYRAAFSVMDKDGNESISAEELGSILRANGTNLTDDEVSDLIKTYDSNGDGDISFEEFTKLMAESSIASAARFAMLFKSLDVNGDGSVSATELQNALQNAQPKGLNPTQIQALLDKAQAMGTGELSFEDFLEAMPK